MSNLFDLLTYRSYAHNRLESPEVSPERWARIFPNAAAMEKRFVREFEAALMQSTTGILDVADQGRSTTELTESITVGDDSGLLEKEIVVRDHSASVSTGRQSAQSLPVPLGREVSGTVEGHGMRLQGARTDSPSLPIDAPAERSVRSGSDGQTDYSLPFCLRTVCPPSENQASPADQILPEPFTLQQTGATASTSLDVVPENFSCFIDRMDEFVAARLPRIADCFCGRPSIHECHCGERICANHSYASLCGTCTEAKQLQQSSVMDGADRYEGAR